MEIINHNLNSLLGNSNIKRVKHSNIRSQQLPDGKNLKRNRNQGEAMSGVQLFCKNIYETMTQKTIEMELIKKSQWYLSTNVYNRGMQIGDTKQKLKQLSSTPISTTKSSKEHLPKQCHS